MDEVAECMEFAESKKSGGDGIYFITSPPYNKNIPNDNVKYMALKNY